MSQFICQPLAKHHDRTAFRCGVEALDRYLHEQASQDVKRRVAAVFVMVPQDEPRRVAGYYSLSAASIILAALPDKLTKQLPRYPLVPAILIGRLARDVNFAGIGQLILVDALARALRHSSEIAAALVLVDAKNAAARKFYTRFGFETIAGDPKRMFLPMKTVESLLSSSQ